MQRISKPLTMTFPPEMVKTIRNLTKEEGRNTSELIREALRRYVEEREWKKIYRYGEIKTRKRRFTESQVENIIDASRR